MSGIGRIGFGFWVGVFFFGILWLSSIEAVAQVTKSKSKKPKSKVTIRTSESTMPRFLPTRSFSPGSVGAYFYPREVGSKWTLRSISSYYASEVTSVGTSERLLASDTAFVTEQVVANNRSSLQLLPLVICKDSIFHSRTKRADEQEAQYYVDDSVIMVVYNNSMLNQDNRVILMSPLTEGYSWPEKQGDTILTTIENLAAHIETPAVTSDSALVTQTFHRGTVLSKFFVQGYGLVKSEYRAPGREAGQRISVETELVSIEPRPIEQR